MAMVRPLSSRTGRRLGAFLGLGAALYMAACVYIWNAQVDWVLAPLATIPSNPQRMGIEFQEVRIPLLAGVTDTVDGLDAFWIPAAKADAPTLLYLHGQDATVGKNLEHVERFHEWGWHVLIPDYRGFGRSYGKAQPTEAKVHEDALAALRYLKSQRQIPPRQILLFGHSLGGAVAIHLATHPESADTAGLIVESSFTSVFDVSQTRYWGLLRLLPIDLLLQQRFDSLSKVGAVPLPILFVHGKDDPKVPFWMTQRLHAAAADTATLCLIEGAGHANCGSIGKVEYREACLMFAESCLSAPRRGEVDLPEN